MEMVFYSTLMDGWMNQTNNFNLEFFAKQCFLSIQCLFCVFGNFFSGFYELLGLKSESSSVLSPCCVSLIFMTA